MTSTTSTTTSAHGPLRVLVVDDEATARRRLLRLLEAMPDVRLAGECADADEALDRVRTGGIDLVLLDIQMPGLSGLDALALWPPDGPLVIFCTAHAEHAVAAFDVGAIDYLLKPIDAARLRKALDRAREADVRQRFRAETERHRRPPDPTTDNPGLPARLPLETRQGIVLLAPAEISHAQLDGALVTVHTTRGPFLCDLSLQDLETSLAPHGFVRVHRRALLNLARVVRLEPEETGGFLARTDDGHAVEVSRQSARDLRKRLGIRR
ncbi:MAG TPA: LytTR family DNA-binding domain-containing protein [Polyangia bacterium]